MTPEKPVDTQYHKETRVRGKHGDTTIWEFKDLRASRPSIYRGFNGLEWALTDLSLKTRLAIEKGEIPGKPPEEGDIIQACVVRYFLDNKKFEPETTPDSPLYATLPYKIIKAPEGGYMTTELAIPPEMAMHLNIPKLVGDLIPNLTPEQKNEVLVTLQLKEATHITQEEVQEIIQSLSGITYQLSSTAAEEAKEFEDFLGKQKQEKQVDTGEWDDMIKSAQDTAIIDKSELQKQKQRRLRKRFE